ncbi:MAG: hypothetical protein ABIQ31_07515 [Ferruginibacter sp.]
MKKYVVFISALFALSCQQKKEMNRAEKMNMLGQKYVRLGLYIGLYDSDFIDAYYGPDSLKPVITKQAVFPKDSLIAAVNNLMTEVKSVITADQNDTLNARANWMTGQLTAFGRRIRIFSGELAAFDEESKELFGVAAPVYNEQHFQSLIAKFDSILPGKGDISTRFRQLGNRFIIPKDKIDTVFKTTIAEARKRALAHYKLPANETFTLEYVTGKPWSGYNWYKGNYNSLIQINTDLPISIERAIDLACHEGYPGHHVYNMLLEEKLYRQKGWVEISLYPLFCPQSLIAEGSANFGIEVAFPGNDENVFIRTVLLPLAGLDTAGIDAYIAALSLRKELNYARNEAARGLLNGTMKEPEVMRWLTGYSLFSSDAALKSVSFIRNTAAM